MVFRKTVFGKQVELDNTELFLVLLIVANFLFISFMMLTHPIPQYLYSDSATHYKMTELIKKDIAFIGYQEYPKGFHLISAFLSYAMPVGTAMALITSFFVALLLFFSYKLSLLVSKDKNLSLVVALFVSTINILVSVNNIATPVPQTIGLALFVTGSYFFLKKDWLKAGLLLGVYSWMHNSFLLLLALFFLLGFHELLKESRIERLVLSLKSLLVVLVFFIPLKALLTVFSSGMENFAFDPKISFYEEMISPFSFFLLDPSVTFPPLAIALALIGVYVLRKELFREQKHFFLFLGLAVPVLLSQAYWIAVIQSPLFLGSRVLYFMLFSLAFFAAEGVFGFFAWLGRLVEKDLAFKGSALFALALLAFSVHSNLSRFNEMTPLSAQDLEVVSFLQEKPVDEVIAAGQKGTGLVTLGLKRNTSQRNFWLMLAESNASKVIDLEKIDYMLFERLLWIKANEVQEIKNVQKVFENREWVLAKVSEGTKFKKATDLYSAVISLARFVSVTYKGFQEVNMEPPYLIMFSAEDSKERVCVLLSERLNMLHSCPAPKNLNPLTTLTVKGKKADLMEALNSFDSDYAKLKFGYLYMHGRISFKPTKTLLAEKDVRYLSCLDSWTSQSPFSKPNQWIANWFCYGLK